MCGPGLGFERSENACAQHSPQGSTGGCWQFLHLAIDDHCCSGSLRGALRAKRIRFALRSPASPSPRFLPDETAHSAIAFLHAALAFFQRHGIQAQRLYSDNGSCSRSHAMRAASAALGLKQRFTRPYTPKTNGRRGGGDKGGWWMGERPSASFKPPSASGLTPMLTLTPISAPHASSPSSTTTTGIALTTPSTSALPSPDSANH